MDLLTTSFRALANQSRLRLLRAAHAKPGISVGHLAQAARMSLPNASLQLSLLRDLEFISAQPDGRLVLCSPAPVDCTRDAFRRELRGLLADLLGAREPGAALKLLGSDADPAAGWEKVYELLIWEATAYTHLRRLLILRRMKTHGPERMEAIAAGVGMSIPAAQRHLDKLARRGLVLRPRAGAPTWELVRPPSTVCRRRLLDMVLRALDP